MSWLPRLPGLTLPPQGRHPAPPSPVPGTVAASLFLAATFFVPLAPAQEYAGTEMCAACHEEIFTKFQKSAHKRIERKTEWTDQACETCHGPGAEHAASGDIALIKNPSKLDAGAGDRSCLACHQNQPSPAGRIRNGHAHSQVSCAECHTVHGTREELVDRRPVSVNKQCATCHMDAWVQFQRPHTHRLAQGAMSCTGCHNPHGTAAPSNLNLVAANEPGCLKCHGDKRGPFTFEHAPVRLEGCQSCHEPHGSANPRMLTRHEVRFQCLECHSNIGASAGVLGGVAPAFHDTRNPRFRNCTVCHVKIHGSHINRALLR
ncbi:MAG: DmsE family decaheme c-type cytochrome [Bryobacterales bacterium]|nr:DmsE family decaheme c-type cytochrome [Bryobacterales bacterium]